LPHRDPHLAAIAQHGGVPGARRLWEDPASRAVGVFVPYRPAPGIAVYRIRVDDYVVMAAEDDLAGPLLDLVTAVLAMGGET
jgi:hypothetical protein